MCVGASACLCMDLDTVLESDFFLLSLFETMKIPAIFLVSVWTISRFVLFQFVDLVQFFRNFTNLCEYECECINLQ